MIGILALQGNYQMHQYMLDSINVKSIFVRKPEDLNECDRLNIPGGESTVISKMMVIGDVKGKDVVIIDDMVDTAGTLTKAADLMIEQGANSVRAICTHGVLSKDAYEKVEASQLEELVITDTIPKQHKSNKIKEISVAELFASTISSGLANKSISNNFIC